MNRKQITILLAAIAAAGVAAVVFWPKETSASWGNTLRGKDGLLVQFYVHGFSTGEPIAAVLTCYELGGESSPNFQWSTTSNPEGIHEFQVDGETVSAKSDFLLFFNGSDGSVSRLAIPHSDARKLFRRDSNPTKNDLLTFWKEHVDSSFEIPNNT